MRSFVLGCLIAGLLVFLLVIVSHAFVVIPVTTVLGCLAFLFAAACLAYKLS